MEYGIYFFLELIHVVIQMLYTQCDISQICLENQTTCFNKHLFNLILFMTYLLHMILKNE